ncbi:hypothetical protein GCM10011572_13320 [Pseudoduganella buxea]|uniref:NnrS family protein n=3 Tax=Pseudoduganella buxea TaxID=1949069 RepID=A0ABQ1KDI0_9BURK|nr:hypothetical protein GCM10011572_13320 [Pseudoduganella buxea]
MAMVERQAFLMLYRVRHAHFRRQSLALYRRYGHALMIFLALFGMAVAERPALLAEPLLHFWRAPQPWPANLAHVAAWLALVTVWAGIHRAFIRGGALAAYSRSLPLGDRAAPLVDLAILYASLAIFLVPFAVALWTVLRAGDPGGADGRFPLYLAVFAGLTLAVARSAVFGPARCSRAVQGGTIAALVFAHLLPAGWPATVLLAAALPCCLADAITAPAHQAGPARGAGGTAPGRGHPILQLARIQASLLVHRHGQAALARLLLAAAPQAACWWLVVPLAKHAESAIFVHLACALTAALTSGFFHTFHVARQPLVPYLRSMAFAAWRLTLAEHLLVLGATATLYGIALACLAAGLGSAAAGAVMLGPALYWLAWLPLLGLPLIQRHKDGILVKFGLLILALVFALTL